MSAKPWTNEDLAGIRERQAHASTLLGWCPGSTAKWLVTLDAERCQGVIRALWHEEVRAASAEEMSHRAQRIIRQFNRELAAVLETTTDSVRRA